MISRLKSYIDKDSVVLAKKQTYRFMEEKKDSRNISIQKNSLLTKVQKQFNRQRVLFLKTNDVGITRHPFEKRGKKKKKKTRTRTKGARTTYSFN